MTQSFQELMRRATLLTNAGRLNEATSAIQRALHSAVERGTPTLNSPARHGSFDGDSTILAELAPEDDIVEVIDPSPVRSTSAVADAMQMPTGTFIDGSHTHASLTRRYKLYVPPGSGRELPLVVMLHGCTQDPDDFAAGTGMNALAAEQGFYVLYPAQETHANPSRCWNWFKHNHHGRTRGEAAVIATMTQAVIQERGIRAEQVYIAGLSAGGAMASLVAAAYPELFAAVGVHSGLAPGIAQSLPEGLAAMRSGTNGRLPPEGGSLGLPNLSRRRAPAELPVRAIVFHGDQDKTVHPRNGDQVVAAVLRSRLGSIASPDSHPVVEHGVSRGRHYTRSTYRTHTGDAIAEHWVVHGAGHAWSGGQAAGSYMDSHGPDASGEMLRFFFQQSRWISD